MADVLPMGSPEFDADFDLARRAVEAGLLTEAQVEAALLAQEREPQTRLTALLPIPPDALHALRPPSARPLPPEVTAAMRDPASRCGGYWIVAKLSEGGMGEVYRGWDGRLGRWVALKFPKRSEAGEARERFVREAGLVARLEHPNVARVYEVGEWEGRPYLAMEFVEGRTLGEALRGAGREQVLGWVRQAAAGVGAAHAAGVIHRDLKPGNIMLDGAGRAVVLDFGLARATDVGDSIPGGSRIVAGTPNYMAPEQAHGRGDARSDVYGLGAVLYEAVTGRPPFVGETAAEVLLQVANREPVPPRRLAPGVSRDCEAIILKCLEKDPARRYAGTAELIEDIDACLGHEPLRRARRRTPLYVLEKSVRRQPLVWSLAALVLALFGAAGAAGLAWFLSPGTIRLAIAPAGATVRIGDRAWRSGAAPLVLELPAGVAEIRVEAPDHAPRTLPILVRRRHTQDLRVDLAHEQGLLEAAADPGDASIEVDGREYGARIRGLALDTGAHELRVSAPGHFERVRVVGIRSGAETRVDFGLEAGELWRVRDEAIQSACTVWPIGDRDGDACEDLAAQELTCFRLLSGASGRDLGRVGAYASPQWTAKVLDLGGGRVLAGWGDARDGLRVTLLDVADGPLGSERTWREPEARRGADLPAFVCVGPDLDGDGWRELVVGGRGGALWVLDARTGAGRRVAVGEDRLMVRTMAVRGRTAVFAGPMHDGETEDGPHFAGAVSLETGELAWSWRRSAGGIRAAEIAGGIALVAYGADGWHAFGGADGAPLWSAPLPGENAPPEFLDTGGDGAADLIMAASSRLLLALHPADGRSLWRHDLAGPCVVSPGPPGSVLCLTQGRLECVEAVTGRAKWSSPAASGTISLFDLDGDGRAEIVTGNERDRITCVSMDGRPLWSLRTRGTPKPSALLRCRDGVRLAYGRGSSFVGVVRPPCELWHADAVGPLIAAPVLAPHRNGAVVAQQGDWGDNAALRAFDAATGDLLWTLGHGAPPNFPPGLADLDGDGASELLAWSDTGPDGSQGLQVLRPRDGERGAFYPARHYTDLYAVPVAADFDGDGAADLAVNLRLARTLIVLAGATAAPLWQQDLGGDSWGGPAAADLDGDARPDLVVPADGRPLRAFRGTDGTPLWEQPLAAGSRHAPVVVRTAAAAPPRLLAVAADGTLLLLDGRTGAVLASDRGGTAAAPIPVPHAAPTHLLVPRGPAGLAALALPDLAPLWTAPDPVTAPPGLADLDGDGRLEAVVAADSGHVLVLDAATGERLWSHSVSNEGCAAAPALGDLDGDGLTDILVADRGGRLTAVRGRAARPSHR